ncbi:MAG: FAD:protein FMN transferase [Bacteroidales bacterium]|jgi:thiamine biosynthesis lipoprotein|nr:FAD:protein FMN transferase [Bacteroidales bacterium]
MRFCKPHAKILCFLWLSGWVFACGTPAHYFTHQGRAEGTSYRIIYESPHGEDYQDDIEQLLERFEASLSMYDPSSLISRINRNDPTAEIDDFFRAVFDKAVEVHHASGGVFDITVAPLVNLWGFGFTSDTPEANPAKIDSLLQFVGMEKVRISGKKLEKESSGVMLDVNAIAKGYSVDVTAKLLKEKGCKNYLVEIGGEVAARGVNASGKTWRVGIDRPADHAMPGETLQAILPLNNQALATSGNYRRFFEIDGVKYAHSIDVKTGYPVRHHLLSATVLSADCMTADAWATVCMVSGVEKSIELIEQHPELEALLIYSDRQGNYRTYVSAGIQGIIE